MRSRTAAWLGFALSIVAPLAVGAEDIHREFEVAPGQLLSLGLDRVGGRIEIEAWDENRVQIEGWTRDLRLEFDQTGDGIDGAPSGYVDDGDDAEVDLSIKGQFDVRLEAQARTRLRGLRGRVEISVGNEDVELDDVQGEARIRATNGDVHLLRAPAAR
jgi:hypothetical protein